MKSRRVWFVFVFSLMLLLGDAAYVGFTFAVPSSTMYGSSGIYPGAPSYTVWREGSTYFAKDAYGALLSDAGSSNASYVINSAITTAPANSSVLFKSATYSIDSTLLFNRDYMTYRGESRDGVKFVTTGNDYNAINITHGPNTNMEHIIVSDFSVIGTGATNTAYGIYISGLWHSIMRNVGAGYFNYGMTLYGTASYSGGGNRFEFLVTHHNNVNGLQGWLTYDSNFDYILSYNNGGYGMALYYVQGWSIERLTARENGFANLLIEGSQIINVIEADISTSTQYGIKIVDASYQINIIDSYQENANFDGLYIEAGEGYLTKGFSLNVSAIRIINSAFVKNNATGIKLNAGHDANITDVRIEDCTILNNGRNDISNFAGIYIGNGTASKSIVRDVWISNTISGNRDFAVGSDAPNNQDYGLSCAFGSQIDYVQVTGMDTPANEIMGISIQNSAGSGIKANSHVSFSYNATSWIEHKP